MLVLIIHLARATHRTAHVQSLVDRLQFAGGVDVRIQTAVDGSALPVNKLDAHVGKNLIRPTYPFALNLGEIGCFLSHREAWQTFLETRHQTCLILEDDADIDTDQLAKGLQVYQDSGASYAQLPHRKPRNWPLKSPQNLTRLCPLALGTTGQILERDAAEQLLKCTQIFDRPIDTFLQMTWHHGVQIHTLYPSMVGLAGQAIAQTTIQRKRRKGLVNELQRSWRRTLYRQKIQRLAHSRVNRP